MADIVPFLQHNVEGYLFSDLRSMDRVIDSHNIALCYPLLMTTFAGIELMGVLLSESTFDGKRNGHEYFEGYWSKYLYPSSNKEIAQEVYQLVRHGIAHMYLLKGDIRVEARNPTKHLKKPDGFLYVDPVKLANDFVYSYKSNIPSILSSDTSAVNSKTMSKRLDDMIAVYNPQAIKHNALNASIVVCAESAAFSHTMPPIHKIELPKP